MATPVKNHHGKLPPKATEPNWVAIFWGCPPASGNLQNPKTPVPMVDFPVPCLITRGIFVYTNIYNYIYIYMYIIFNIYIHTYILDVTGLIYIFYLFM